MVEPGYASKHGLTCTDRNERFLTIKGARFPQCVKLETWVQGDFDRGTDRKRDETMKKVMPNKCGQHRCFRDDAPDSALAQRFRKYDFGMQIDQNYQATIDPSSVSTSLDTDMDQMVATGVFDPGAGGTNARYTIYIEGTDNRLPTPPDYVDFDAINLPKNEPGTDATEKAPGLPPAIKDDNDGSSRRKPVWRAHGSEYHQLRNKMPKPNLLLTGTIKEPVPPGVYNVEGDTVRTGSHTICAAFEYNCKGYGVEPQKGYENCPLKEKKHEILINYGPPETGFKGMYWKHDKWKDHVGGHDQSHLSMINVALSQKIYRNKLYRKQLKCSVYDAHNNWMSVYINGVLFAERALNQYVYHPEDGENGEVYHTWEVSQQFADSIDVVHNDLWVGKGLVGDDRSFDFKGRFTFVGVWNHFVMNKRQACLMAGIKEEQCPEVCELFVFKENATMNDMCFTVSGSNPVYTHRIARKRQ